MTIWQWAVCGLGCAAIIQWLAHELRGKYDGLGFSGRDAFDGMLKSLVAFGYFALLGYLWNL